MPGKPFSSKQKKEQLKFKREKKRNTKDETSSGTETDDDKAKLIEEKPDLRVKFADAKKINEQPRNREKREQNKFNLQFMKESLEELKRNKKLSYKALEYHDEKELEVELEDFYKPNSPLDMPLRPKWYYEMTKEQLERNENKYFDKYLSNIFEMYPHSELSYFEMNLETWRQLWRVLEISDIILLIVDIRFPVLHFSPTLVNYCHEQNKDVILVLNKIDLVTTSVVIAWQDYFKTKYPKLHVLLFSSSKQIKYKRDKKKAKVYTKKTEGEETNDQKTSQPYLDEEEQAEIKAAAAEVYTAKAHRLLYEKVKEIVSSNEVNLNSWNEITELEVKQSLLKANNKTEELANTDEITNDDELVMNDLINSRDMRKKFEHGFVTIGCCGFPNVGKSSLLNSLKGKKCVSVSKTPGHTKHLQTIFLTKNVRLCDCPGLVFPSLSCKPLQVLAGIYPIAQLQEPYRAIRYLAENIPMVDLLKIKHPTAEDFKNDQFYKDKVYEWTPSDICEGWAIKRGYFTAKACRPDVYRAANELLRMALDGRLCISLKPKNYSQQKDFWETHLETKKLDEVIKDVGVIVKERLEFKLNDESTDEEEGTDNFERSNEESEVKSDDDDDDNTDEGAGSKNPYALLEQE